MGVCVVVVSSLIIIAILKRGRCACVYNRRIVLVCMYVMCVHACIQVHMYTLSAPVYVLAIIVMCGNTLLFTLLIGLR